MNKTYWYGMFFLLTLLSANTLVYFHNRTSDVTDCSGKIVVSNDSDTLKATAYFYLSDTVGRIIIEGTLENANGEVKNIRRSALFSPQAQGGDIILTNSSVSVEPADNDSNNKFETLLPSFFWKENSRSLITLHKIFSGRLLISHSQFPQFLCEKY